MSRRRLIFLVFLLGFAGLFFIPTLMGMLVDWWWFQEIGNQVVFTRELVTEVLLFLVVGGLTFAVIYLNLRIAQRGLVPYPVVLRFTQGAPRVDLTQPLRRLSLPGSLFLGLLAGLAATPAWSLVLRLIYRTPFGIADPVFGRDVGYYVFTLPGLSAALGFLSGLTVISLVLVLPIYALRGDIVFRPRRLAVEPSAGMHLAGLLAVFFVLLALRLWLVDIPNLLFSTTGPLVGASYTDLHATLPALHVSAVVAVLSALAVLYGGMRRELGRYAVLAIGGYLAVAFVGRALFPGVMQKFVVSPTELTRETPYLRYHIAATRQAWGLDSVETRELKGEANLTLADIKANAPTIENVRLWDRDPLLQTFGQLQEIRTYYDFVSVDDDRYQIDGRYRQILLSPRELNARSLPTRTFINEHLTFTHGMGLTMSPVNQVTTEGLPVLFIKDLPPASTVSLKVSRPQIYYGEITDPYVFVGTRQREFDHPSGEKNVYASYQGKGGVPIGNIFRRAILAAQFGSSKILFSGDITGASRVLYNRTIMERARKALPFLIFDRDPYLVVAGDGTLKWILDAYTATRHYPYAEALRDGTSYMRNSVKLVIDAYDGTLAAYVSAPGDPLIRTWSRIFPGIFVPMERMPADLRAHIRYPDGIYRIQTGLYTTYHMDDPEDFYHREDQWQIPVADEGGGSVPFMRHLVMRLPEEKNAEYIYMVPFTPRGKDNLAAWMVARNDGDEYGRLRVYSLPRQSLVFGPRQIVNRINQDTEISRQISLWDQRGSRVIRGDLLVIPIEEALLYVQPLYLQAEGGRIPELKRVVVAYQNRVVMRETLDEGLAELFGGAVAGRESRVEKTPVSTGAPATVDSRLPTLFREAKQHYDAAIQAQRELDWARYGDEMRQLGEVLEQLGK
nr:rhomboid family integral membrane protein [uncultured bacterium]